MSASADRAADNFLTQISEGQHLPAGRCQRTKLI
jgi:hypothetical protein